MTQSIHIIGGGAGIGRWLLDKVFSIEAIKIYCYDTNNKTLDTLQSSVTRCFLSEECGLSSFSDQFQSGDLVLLVVPLTVFESTVVELAKILKPGSLVVTLSSIQLDPINILKEHIPSNCSICGCHPLFGPAVSSPVGQLVALIEYNQNQTQHKALRDTLERAGLIVSTLDPEQHDNYMSYVQALAHFALIGFAATLGKDNIPPSDLLKLKTPNFQFLYAFASRVIKLSPTTTGAIQSTKAASRIRANMLKTMNALHEGFEKSEGAAGCAEIIEEMRKPLTAAEIDEGAELAAMAADSLQDFEEILFKYKKSEAPFVFKQRATGQLRIVRITDIRHDEIAFDEATKYIEKENVKYRAVGLNDIARKNYQALGLNIPNAISITMKKRNIKLLDSNELNDFYKKIILPISMDFNFTNRHEMREDYFEKSLPLLIRGLWKCEYLESYRKRGEIGRVNLRLSFNPNESREEIVSQVRAVIESEHLYSHKTF